ncbi:hypothetical protein BDN70DRAFT_659901 [Pholiota conissans]|uniref:Uncharacterized protein n=1 Tax=Pholiota conissans TaxID=109636 RepID=A0A9P5YN96_9AGAR|nr:hypothetical protein BDN70DRAFT_659901 [Pholiota conissans]
MGAPSYQDPITLAIQAPSQSLALFMMYHDHPLPKLGILQAFLYFFPFFFTSKISAPLSNAIPFFSSTSPMVYIDARLLSPCLISQLAMNDVRSEFESHQVIVEDFVRAEDRWYVYIAYLFFFDELCYAFLGR